MGRTGSRCSRGTDVGEFECLSKPVQGVGTLICYEQTIGQRRIVGGNRTAPAAGTPQAQRCTSPVANRAALTGIIVVLETGIRWELLPQEMGCGVTCWRRLWDWQALRMHAQAQRTGFTLWDPITTGVCPHQDLTRLAS